LAHRRRVLGGRLPQPAPPRQGAAAYLNAGAVIAAATASGAEAGLTFVGPQVAHLELFGDKARARAAAVAASVPVAAYDPW
ncbi:MAG: hypothetical protein ACRDHY_18605, partial [Anaerolineales bacterium]